jgi:hypothetical protein
MHWQNIQTFFGETMPIRLAQGDALVAAIMTNGCFDSLLKMTTRADLPTFKDFYEGGKTDRVSGA